MRRSPDNQWGPLPPHSAVPHQRGSKWVERLLFLVAFVALGYYGYVRAEAYLYQAYETRELEAILHSAPAPPSDAASSAVTPRAARPAGSLIGRIEIPRLRVSAIVRVGSDARTLRLAVGHIPGTAYPGEHGNVGLAGHRDTFFRQLQHIRADDVIRIATADGTYSYRVERTTVVNPRDVWVLDPADRDVLTLITCYPFTYIGSAPQRFIVRAVYESDTRTAMLNR
jgi:sortase A